MIRLAALGFVWDLSYFVSLPLGAWLYNSGSYVCVLATSLILYCLACLLGMIRLWSFKEKMIKTHLTFKGCDTKSLPCHTNRISRASLTKTCYGLLEGDLQKAAGEEAHLPAVHDGGNAALHDGGERRDVLPVHVHQENVPMGDGPGNRQSRKTTYSGFHPSITIYNLH